jgi:hypothetical protein
MIISCEFSDWNKSIGYADNCDHSACQLYVDVQSAFNRHIHNNYRPHFQVVQEYNNVKAEDDMQVYISLLLLLFILETPELGIHRNYKSPNNLSP